MPSDSDKVINLTEARARAMIDREWQEDLNAAAAMVEATNKELVAMHAMVEATNKEIKALRERVAAAEYLHDRANEARRALVQTRDDLLAEIDRLKLECDRLRDLRAVLDGYQTPTDGQIDLMDDGRYSWLVTVSGMQPVVARGDEAKRLAAMAREPGRTSRWYLVDGNGMIDH